MTYDVVIAGGGPVGLLLANLLGARGIHTLVVERNLEPEKFSKAIGITPPSLEILQRAGLLTPFIRAGVAIDTICFHNNAPQPFATLRLQNVRSPFPFVLGLPQQRTCEFLTAGLQRFRSVTLRRGVSFAAYEDQGGEVSVHCFNRVSARDEAVQGKYLVACDGARSMVREAAGVRQVGGRDPDTFFMGDYADRTAYGNEAHLFFTHQGAVESFPITGGKRRWIIQTDSFADSPRGRFLEDTVFHRIGVQLDAQTCTWQSPFGVQRLINERFSIGRVIFCGDAAHVISPIGGQGMNTGFADADFLADILHDANTVRSGVHPDKFARYESCRKKAARAAIWRAWFGMQIGTIRGVWASAARNALLKAVLDNRILGQKLLPNTFTMLNIPRGGRRFIELIDSGDYPFPTFRR